MNMKRSRVEAAEAIIGMELPVSDPESMKAEIIAGATPDAVDAAFGSLTMSESVDEYIEATRGE